MFHSKNKVHRILMWLITLCYAACWIVLIVEASLPGEVSADHSNTIGGGIADIINNNAGDQTVLVEPTAVKINNKKSDIFISESFTLETKIEPENCSYQSLTFLSEDESIATIDEQGKVTGKKEGTTTIQAASTNYPQYHDAFTLHVHPILETGITSNIANLVAENGIYTLEANKQYRINTTFTPSNTTDQTLSYSLSIPTLSESEVNSYIGISNDILMPYKESKDHIIEIEVKSRQGYTSTLKAKIIENKVSIINLTSLSLRNPTNYELSVNESISFTSKFQVAFTPNNATYKQYKITSDDPSIIQVTNTTLKALKVGETNIKIKAVQDENISASLLVKVTKKPLKDVQIQLSLSEPRLQKGGSATLRYQSPSPSNADSIIQKLYTYSSSNTEVATITQTGQIKAINKGNTTLSLSFYNSKEEKENNTPAITKSIDLEVFEPTTIDNFSIKNNLNVSNDSTLVLYNNNNYNLTSTIKIDKMYKDGKEVDYNREKISTELTFKISSTSSNTGDMKVEIRKSGSSYYLDTTQNDNPGTILIEYTHSASKVSYSLSYTILNEVSPTIEREEDSRSLDERSSGSKTTFNGKDYDLLSDSLSIYVTSSGTVSFSEKESYQFTYENSFSNCAKLASVDDHSFSFQGIDQGNFQVLITPIYNGTLYDGVSKVMKVNIEHKLVKSFLVQLFDQEGKEVDLSNKLDEDKNIVLPVEVDQTFSLKTTYTPFENPTKYNLVILSDHKDIGEYKEEKFIFHKVGTVTFTIKEEISSYQKKIIFHIKNRVKLDETNPISLKQDKAKYDAETNTYHIENGMPAKIITNFDPSSTYQKVEYQSSDTNILKVGNDGKITPIKVGKADILCRINDHNSIDLTFTIHMEVDKKSLINNMSSFLYKIRKGLGHFGAFLITAIFSTLFYFFAFEDKKNLFFSIPFTFLQGFFLAEFTEFIQLFTPGRSGLFSDVLIDFTGFSIGAGITLVVLILYYLIKFIIKKEKEKKQKETK